MIAQLAADVSIDVVYLHVSILDGPLVSFRWCLLNAGLQLRHTARAELMLMAAGWRKLAGAVLQYHAIIFDHLRMIFSAYAGSQ